MQLVEPINKSGDCHMMVSLVALYPALEGFKKIYITISSTAAACLAAGLRFRHRVSKPNLGLLLERCHYCSKLMIYIRVLLLVYMYSLYSRSSPCLHI